jgi:hypothetical protein
VGDWPRLVNLRRCARATAYDGGESTNTTVALTNNTASSELILVWQLYGIGAGFPLQTTYLQGVPPFSTVVPVAALVPGDAPPPGIVSQGDYPSILPADFVFGIGSLPTPWPATFPFAVLQPNWSLVIQSFGGGTGSVQAALFWEAILPKYFDRFYTHQLLEIELAPKG